MSFYCYLYVYYRKCTVKKEKQSTRLFIFFSNECTMLTKEVIFASTLLICKFTFHPCSLCMSYRMSETWIAFVIKTLFFFFKCIHGEMYVSKCCFKRMLQVVWIH